MREMHLSWRELQDTPLYVRRYMWDFLNARRTAEANANEKANRG